VNVNTRTIGLLFVLAAGTAVGDDLVPQKEPPAGTQPNADCDRVCMMRKQVDRHLALMGEIGEDAEKAVQASQRELVALGPPVVRVVHDAYNYWTRTKTPGEAAPARPGEMRWRAAYLLAELGFPDAKRLLYDIALRDGLDSRTSEVDFVDEHRVKLRAVAGLERLKAVEELKVLHARGGTLANATAAALFEVGVNVGRVTRIDARTALAKDIASPADYKPGKGRPPQPIRPGEPLAPDFKVQPRPDSPKAKSENGGVTP
jgi:hypothetical protein